MIDRTARRELRVLIKTRAPLTIKGFMAATIVAGAINRQHGRGALNSKATTALLAGVILVPFAVGLAGAAVVRRVIR